MEHRTREIIIVFIGALIILFGLLANPFFLMPVIRLTDGQISFLRLVILLMLDVTALCIGLFWIKRRKQIAANVKKVYFSVTAIAMTLLLMEGLLQGMTRLWPSFDRTLSNTLIPLMIPDEQLGIRPNPEFPEHDANGFRNRQALSQADIVAIGDSQTYGTAVKRHQAWPHQLSRLSGCSVYSMSFGGYGAVEGLALLEEAIALKPKLVIFTMYNGNDLVDAFDAVYNLGLYPELKTEDSARQVIDNLEQTRPLLSEIKKITANMWSIEPETKPGTLTQKEKQNIAKKMIKQTKLIQLFFAVERITQKTIMNTRNRQWYAMKYSKKHDSPLYEHFKTQDFETVFTSGYRRLAMNLDDPRISEGLTISLKALSKMKQKTESCQIDFLVVLISTKEMVFSNYYKDDRIELSDSMHWLSEQEYVIRSRVQEYLKQQGISYIDTLPALTQCLQQRHQPYFVDADGHLNAVGQRTVAESVHDVLKAADQR